MSLAGSDAAVSCVVPEGSKAARLPAQAHYALSEDVDHVCYLY